MNKVWVIKNNGQNHEEHFGGSEEATNYAKQLSLRSLCTFKSEGKNIVGYEHGEQITDKERLRELFAMTEEIVNSQYEYYAKDGRGKACKRKV